LPDAVAIRILHTTLHADYALLLLLLLPVLTLSLLPQ
jgi:hypothetical protein